MCLCEYVYLKVKMCLKSLFVNVNICLIVNVKMYCCDYGLKVEMCLCDYMLSCENVLLWLCDPVIRFFYN